MMNPFTFQLARLLKLRQLTERQQARALGDALQAEEQNRRVVDEATSRRDSARRAVADGVDGPAPAGLLARLSEVVGMLSARVEAARLAHHQATERVQQEQDRYLISRQHRRVLERLRDRRRAAWQVEANRHEQSDLDERAARVAARTDGDVQ